MKKKLLLFLTLMLCGRAMTLAFITRAGGSSPGDPPVAWLMPLIGDAVIGITGLWVAYLIVRKTGLWVWTTIMIWNSIAIWDALSAFVVQKTSPWPDFFMLEIFGSSMSFGAALLHLAIIVLLNQREIRSHYLIGC